MIRDKVSEFLHLKMADPSMLATRKRIKCMDLRLFIIPMATVIMVSSIMEAQKDFGKYITKI